MARDSWGSSVAYMQTPAYSPQSFNSLTFAGAPGAVIIIIVSAYPFITAH